MAEKSDRRDRAETVGAGFGGLAAAKRLAGQPLDVTIVRPACGRPEAIMLAQLLSATTIFTKGSFGRRSHGAASQLQRRVAERTGQTRLIMKT
jgi:NADH dehydrogenase FAD-containing subunit